MSERLRLALVDSLTRNLDEAVGETAVDQLLELVGETGVGLLRVAHSNRLAARMSRSLRLGAGRGMLTSSASVTPSHCEKSGRHWAEHFEVANDMASSFTFTFALLATQEVCQ